MKIIQHKCLLIFNCKSIKKPYEDIHFTYIGDGRNNMANALMQGAAIMGMTFHLVCPKELRPKDELLKHASHWLIKRRYYFSD